MKKLLAGFLFVITAYHVYAQSSDAVIKEYINAIGGIDKIKKIQSMKATGNFQQGGMNIPFIMYQKRPNKMLLEVTFQGMTQKQAYDGETAWTIDPFQGRSNPEKMDADGAKATKFQADIDGPLVDHAEKGHKVEYVGEEDIDGSPALHLKLTTSEGDGYDYYLDKESYLLVKEKSHVKMQDGSTQDSETNYSDYKEVNGVRVAHTIEIVNEYQGQKYSSFLKIDNIEQNVTLDDAMFIMP